MATDNPKVRARIHTKPFLGGYELLFVSEVLDGQAMDTTVELRQRGDLVGARLLTIAGESIDQFYNELIDTFDRHRI